MTGWAPLDPECRVEPAEDLVTVDGGHILLGGAPFGLLRLSDRGAKTTRGWFAGQPVGDAPDHHELARRLQARGMAHLNWPHPQSATSPQPGFSVVIPVRDDPDGLASTVASIDGGHGLDGPSTLLIVDDGSSKPVTVDGERATVIRRTISGGPGTARNDGQAQANAPIIVFIDAGVTAEPTALAELCRAFADPDLMAVAPRVRSAPSPHLVGRYDRWRSPLDMGSTRSLVGPGRKVAYVPSACLAVRSDAFEQVGGFDPRLRYGEDVDLVWRLSKLGHVGYLPAVEVEHQPRRHLRAMLEQRFRYGSAAGPLARRHGHQPLAPLQASPSMIASQALIVAGRPLAASGVVFGSGLVLGRRLRPLPAPVARSVMLVARGHRSGALTGAAAMTRTWAPLLVAAAACGPTGRRLASIAGLSAMGRRLVDGPREPVPALVDLGVGLLDDLAYCAGLWQGAARAGTSDPLRPLITRRTSDPGHGRAVVPRLGVRRLRGRSRPDETVSRR